MASRKRVLDDDDYSEPSSSDDSEDDGDYSEKEEKPKKQGRFKQGRGSKVQQYAADGRSLVRTFVGFSDALRVLVGAHEAGSSEPPSDRGIRLAAERNTLYHGSRWALLDRKSPDGTVQDLPPTAVVPASTSRSKARFVAMLNPAKTRVDRVFADLTSAKDERGLNSVSAISNALSRGTKSSGQYWQWWDTVDAALKQEYLSRAELPVPMPRVASIAVERSPLAGAEGEVTRFDSVKAAIMGFPMSRGNLLRAIEDKTPYKGFMWRYA